MKNIKTIMTTAWKIAKMAARKFGDKASVFFAESLKMAWASAKASEKAVIKFTTGTKAQKQYATDIARVVAARYAHNSVFAITGTKLAGNVVENVKTIISLMGSDAAIVINKFKNELYA